MQGAPCPTTFLSHLFLDHVSLHEGKAICGGAHGSIAFPAPEHFHTGQAAVCNLICSLRSLANLRKYAEGARRSENLFENLYVDFGNGKNYGIGLRWFTILYIYIHLSKM